MPLPSYGMFSTDTQLHLPRDKKTVVDDDADDSGDLQSPAELERLHPVPVQTVLLPLVGSMPVTVRQRQRQRQRPLNDSDRIKHGVRAAKQ